MPASDESCSSRPGARLTCDRVVHLPLLSGPNCPGVPCDANGFVLVDDAFRVRDDDDVFAVGDATAGPYKQGGLAAQQADVVAEQIAWQRERSTPRARTVPSCAASCGPPTAPATCAPSRPGNATSAEVSDECLWWPRQQGRGALADAVARGSRPRASPAADVAQAADRRHQQRHARDDAVRSRPHDAGGSVPMAARRRRATIAA